MPPEGPKRWRALEYVAAGGLALAVLAAAARKLGDFDLPWHLAVGRATLAGPLPSHDAFSYTFAGAAVPNQYVGDVLLYLAARAGGALGLQLLGALTLGALAWLSVARATAAARGVGLAATALALVAGGPWWVVRPALFSFPLLAAALLLLERHRRRALTTRGLLWLWPLQLLWVNVHAFAVGGAALALGYGGYVAACRLLRGRAGFPAEDGRDAAAVLAIAVGAAGATCLSPWGWRVFAVAAGMGDYRALITEWAPTTLAFVLRHAPLFGLLAVLALVALVAGREPDGRRAPSAFDALVVAGALALALLGVRLIPLFAVAAAPTLARRLAPRLATSRAVHALVLAACLAAAPGLWTASGPRPGLGFDETNLPEGATRWLARHPLAGPLFNFLPFGGHLIYRLPEVRVFVDGRTATLYPLAFVRDYERAEHDPQAFAALAQRWGFAWAVVRARGDERFAEPIAADPRWVMVYQDDAAAIYVRADGVNRAAAGAGYRVLRHLTPPALALLRPPPAALLAHDAALAVAQAPASPRAHFLAAAAALAGGDARAAAVERERVVALDADYPGLPLLAAALARATH